MLRDAGTRSFGKLKSVAEFLNGVMGLSVGPATALVPMMQLKEHMNFHIINIMMNLA